MSHEKARKSRLCLPAAFTVRDVNTCRKVIFLFTPDQFLSFLQSKQTHTGRGGRGERRSGSDEGKGAGSGKLHGDVWFFKDKSVDDLLLPSIATSQTYAPVVSPQDVEVGGYVDPGPLAIFLC